MNEQLPMNTEEFAECLDRWSGDLERWPPAQRAAARDLLAGSKRAGELLAEAQRLDGWLESASDHQAPMGLQRRILDQLPAQDALQRTIDWFSAALWRPALAATCMLLVGYTLGATLAPMEEDPMLDDVSMLVFSTAYEELGDAQQ